MRSLILSLFILIGASVSRAEDKVAIEGHGDWGTEVLGNSTSQTGLVAFVTTPQVTAVLGSNLVASVVISNTGPESITIDTPPIETIQQPEAEHYSSETRWGGSSITISLYQLNADGRLDGFRTLFGAIGFDSREANIVLHPGDVYVETITLLVAPSILGNPVAFHQGPARVSATIYLTIDGNRILIPCQECTLMLKNNEDHKT